MNKFPVVSAIVLVVALVGSVCVSRRMRRMRVEVYQGREGRQKLIYFPLMGVGKFLADIEWIRLIQQMGDVRYQMKPDAAGKQAAQHFYRQVDWITNFRPDAHEVFKIAAGHIADADLDKAVELLEKSGRVSKEENWEIPYHCSAYMRRKDFDQNLSEEKKKEALVRAAKYLKQAIDIGNTNRDLEPQWLRLLARIDGVPDDSLRMLERKKEHYDDKMELRGGTDTGEPGMVGDIGMDDSNYQKARQKMRQEAQKLGLENWRKLQADPSPEEKGKLDKDRKTIAVIFADLDPPKHYSQASLLPYASGDRYDAATGTAVEPYGICKACDRKGKTTVLKGDYCHVCGTQVVKPTK